VYHSFRVGNGYDVHPLVKNRPLILGGVTIPFEKGLDGHSDADALTHAIMDALLGAAGLGDIGMFFPDTDACYKNISSLVLLEKIYNILIEKGWAIINIDAVITAQRPKLSPFFPEMKANMVSRLALSPDAVNIQATTEENMGFTGQGLGIKAYAVCLIYRE
jgi:2-C-methyl-D-erythritol 2,4-cyclodiphosphate synthase